MRCWDVVHKTVEWSEKIATPHVNVHCIFVEVYTSKTEVSTGTDFSENLISSKISKIGMCACVVPSPETMKCHQKLLQRCL